VKEKKKRQSTFLFAKRKVAKENGLKLFILLLFLCKEREAGRGAGPRKRAAGGNRL
jgi:hypothetical protein